MKSIGGLTHGRGINESVISKWISTMSIVFDISEAVSDFFGIFYGTSEQDYDQTKITSDGRHDNSKPLSLFQRICILKKNEKDLRKYFRYE